MIIKKTLVLYTFSLVALAATCNMPPPPPDPCPECPAPDTVIQVDTLFRTVIDTVIQTDTVRLVRVDTVIQRDSVFADTLTRVEHRFRHKVHRYNRHLDWTLADDTLPGFRIAISGTTSASRIRFASKCIGYDSLRTVIDDRRFMKLVPDSSGWATDTTGRYFCSPPGGNALLTYWLTAFKDTTIAGLDTTLSITNRFFIDIGHLQYRWQ